MSMEKRVSRQEDHPEEEALTSSICSIEKVQAVQRKEKLDSFPLKLHWAKSITDVWKRFQLKGQDFAKHVMEKEVLMLKSALSVKEEKSLKSSSN